jgi:hypothetical protein
LALKAYGNIINLLEEWGLIKKPNIVNAILCSYYRCTEGCVSSLNVENLKWEEIDPNTGKTKTVFCREFCAPNPSRLDYTCDSSNCYSCLDCKACIDAGCGWCMSINKCLPLQNLPPANTPNFYCLTKGKENTCPKTTGYTDANKGTICGEQARQYPVVIKLNNSETIFLSHFQEIGAKLSVHELDLISLLVKISQYIANFGARGIYELVVQENCIFFMNPGGNYVKYTKESPEKCFDEFKCYEELKVKEGTYSIFTDEFLGDKSTYVQPLS